MTAETFLNGRVTLHCGDSRDVLKTIPDCSIDSIVTDPPYALVSIVRRFGKPDSAPAKGNEAYQRASAGFMGKQWDTGETAFATEFWAECLRVLKPGGHVVAFSGTRTYHRMACAIEDAGFEVRDMLSWLYGSGFPKSHDVSKGIDKLDAAEERRSRALRFTAWMRSTGITSALINETTGTVMASHYLTEKEQPSVATRQHLEAMRPHLGDVPTWVEDLVDEREVESQNFKARPVLGKYDREAQAAAWRAAYVGGSVAPASNITAAYTPEAIEWHGWGTALKPACEPICFGRKPMKGTVAANVLEHGTGAINIDGCRVGTTREVPASHSKTAGSIGAIGIGARRLASELDPNIGRWPANIIHDGSEEVIAAFPDAGGGFGKRGGQRDSEYGFGGTMETVGYGDEGSAARFFYTAKADADDRLGSKHPTVKPVDLMQWLCRLVTPKGGTVLDPFAGTGTTGEAAFREGFNAVLIEREEEYQGDIRRRMALCMSGPDERRRESIKAKVGDVPFESGSLFAGLGAAE